MAKIVIAHRGASGYRPEHTLESYRLAIEQGADFIEPDLVMTRDGVLVARHENEIGGTTDIAQRAEFAARRTRKVIDGIAIDGWFAEDFALAELKTLRARERIAALRPDNARYDGRFAIPTFDEVIALAKSAGRRVGVYPETKHPSYFAGIGLAMEGPLLEALRRAGLEGRDAPVFIQSFETGNLRGLRKQTRTPLIQLIEAQGRPFDLVSRGDSRTYRDLVSAPGLAEIASYADGVGVHKSLVVPRDANERLAAPTTLVRDAHACGLQVHAWTFRAENEFLPLELRSSVRGADRGNLRAELDAFLAAGIDGLFADHPDIARAAVRGAEGAGSSTT